MAVFSFSKIMTLVQNMMVHQLPLDTKAQAVKNTIRYILQYSCVHFNYTSILHYMKEKKTNPFIIDYNIEQSAGET